jgi:hypothetical protein
MSGSCELANFINWRQADLVPPQRMATSKSASAMLVPTICRRLLVE